MSRDDARPLRVLHVVDSLEFGGLERVVCDLAKAQQRADAIVRVFSLNRTDGFRAELEEAGVTVISGDKSGSFDRQTIARLRDAIRRERIDVVHAHSFVPNYYAAVALLPIGLRRPALLGTCHDMGQRLSNPRLRRLYRLSLLRTARVAMVGKQVHQRLTSSGIVPARKAVVVRNGIPLDAFVDNDEVRREARRALDLPEDVLVIGAVGRVVDLKNHRSLIRLMPALLKHDPTLRLCIVGDGPLSQPLQADATLSGVATSVRWAGARTDVPALLPAFDIFAMPSLTEGLSIALMEACASGRAIVTTRVGGNPETIVDGQNGLLVDPDNDEQLGAALRRLLDDPALRQRLAQSAREWAAAHASVDATAAVYDRLYRQMLRLRA